MKVKDKRIIIKGIILFILTAIIVLSTYFVKKVNNQQANLSSEILRSMNYTQITDEDSKVENTDFVKFSAFFTRDLDGDGNAEKLLGTCRNINSTDQLYIDLNVLTNGYLKDGVIKINGTNFKYNMSMVKDSVLKNNYISDDVKTIELNQINAGTQKLIIGNVLAYIGDDTNNYSNVSSITLTGTHVSDEGVETPVSKTIDLTVDWHGTTRASIWYPLTFYYNYDELDSTTVSFNIKLEENKEELILKENVITVTIPELNGYAPTEVKCINDNIESQYNSETRKLTIRRTSEIDENGIITRTISRKNTYSINITYPQEAYDEISSYTTLTIPMEGYYTGYNNTNNEFNNPYTSNIVKEKITLIFREKPKGSIYNFYVDLMDKKYTKIPNSRYVISKQDILDLYNVYDEETTEEILNKEYIVRWQAIRGPEGEVPSMTMSETKSSESSYGDKWDNTIMEEYVTNTGIYFTNADNMLEEDGTIKVYNNDTNELIHIFTKQEWNIYTKENPYKYDVPVRHIRVETSKTNLNASLSVYNIKSLEVSKILKDFTKEEIENIDLIYTYLTGICNIEGQSSGTVNDIDNAYYVSNKSNSKISVQTQEFSTQEVVNNQKIYIDAIYNQEGDSRWKNGEFLVELPEDIVNMQINRISVNTGRVKIVAYDVYQKDGKYFVKIMTENENPTDYRITIDCNLTPDPRSASANKKVKLYSYNEYCNDYYYEAKDIYDVNSNNNTEEKVGISETTINLLSPTSLITLEMLSNYNQENEITVAPNIAEIEKETRQATINISLTNNYPNTVSGVQILGKIPFEGNKNILNGKDLGSKFTTTMTDKGITIPEELKEKVVIYYSEKENPNKNLEDAENGWTLKEDVQDFSKIKTYFIDLKEYTIQVGKDYTFNYVVNIPENVKNNLVSYSDHAVYYELNTPEGNLQLSTEPNKVGIKVVRKFGLDLVKYKKGSNTLKVAGATYILEYKDIEGVENTEEYPDIDYNAMTRILTTNSDGTASLNDLYVGVTYKIKEQKSPDNYTLNNEITEFKVIEDEQGNLQLETNSEKVILDKEIEKVKINTEDEPKYNITITKTDSKTGENLSNISFRLNGKVYTTDRNGQIIIERLEQNTEYTLKEIKATGYYILEDITFRLVKNEEGNLQIESNNVEFLNGIITNNDDKDLIQIDVNLENEKIPTYDLQILKVAEDFKEEDIEKLTPLSEAKFNLKYTDLNTERYYTTEEDGIINIQDLYQYVDGKYITGTYILQELQAPEGYANNAEEIQFKVSKNEEGILEVHVENRATLETIRAIQVEENTVKIIIQDKPLFKLFKTDSKTGEPLANAQFVIYEVDSNKSDIDYAKDVNGNYVGEINENGQYVVTTDETGTIILPLKGGLYRIVEIGYPEGYYENANEQYFKVADGEEETEPVDPEVPEEKNILEINSIEDLVELSNAVNSGNNDNTKIIKLMRTLDFTENSSYENPNDTSYGDINEDGAIEGIKEELTSGCGFMPIGKPSNPFLARFDGKGNELRNIYINRIGNYEAAIGVFGFVANAEINNLGVTGNIRMGSCTGYHLSAGGIAGWMDNSSISNCYNKANITSEGVTPTIQGAGGIAGVALNSSISNCYNEGDISAYVAGGIVGYGGNISNCYNRGNIIYNNDNSHGQLGGIVGWEPRSIINCYNTGDICGNSHYAGGIVGLSYSSSVEISNSYYLNTIEITCKELNTSGSAVSSFEMISKDFYNKLNTDNVWLFRKGSYPKLNIGIPIKVEESTEINIENKLKKFDITTEIAQNSEGERAGGTITGEYTDRYLENNNIKFIETINYNCDNTEEIIINPDEGYLICKIAINGEELDFGADEEGNYKIPVGYFEKIKQNYHIIVTFERSNRTLIINKVDSEDKSKSLSGAEFMVEKVDERPAVTNEVRSIVGFVDGTLVTGVLGSLTENGTYYFTNSNGTYISNNHASSSTAKSYIPIDLTNRSGEYRVVVNAKVSSESGYDCGYATITQSTTAPAYNNSTGQFMKISGTVSAKDYEYTLQGGKMYYLHLGYRKDGSGSSGDDRITINSINVYHGIKYNFTQSNGKYMSSNQNKDNTVSNSYIPIDLTNCTGKYTLNVNAEVSSESGNDYGYATITTDTSSPVYTSDKGRFIYISGTESAKDYTTILEAGKMYYLHLGYRKGGSVSVGADTFTINSVNLSLNTDDYYREKHTTNSYGEIKVALPYGRYKLTETKAPEGYALDSNPKEIVLEETNTSITIENKKPKSFEITKVDKETNEPIPNTKFAIYRISEDYEIIDFIKNNNGEYIGQKNDDGVYVISTDEDGKIKLSLGTGLYKAVEIESADGYTLEESEELRTTYFKIEDSEVSSNTEENNQQTNNIEISSTDINNTDIVINNIEDLVRLSNNVNSGNTYEGKTIVLSKTLDFNEDTSYSNPEDTSFGDYNGDGTPEGIKEELTKEASTGFKPIGMNYSFKGTFNGNNNEIKNIYINRSSYSLGLFGKIEDSKIINLGVTGNIGYSAYEMGAIAGGANNSIINNCYNKARISTTGPCMGGIVGIANNSTITNCYNVAEISSNNAVGGVVGVANYSNMVNCYNLVDINSSVPVGGVIYTTSNSKIKNCYNTGNINNDRAPVGGVIYTASNSEITGCYNLGNINSNNAPVGGIIYGITDSEIANCYNEGNVTGKYGAGGISNSISNTKLVNCYNTGTINGNSSPTGGIAYNISNNSKVWNCYNTGSVIGSSPTGGLAYSISNNSKVWNCYNTGSVIGSSPTGGLAYSISNSTLVNCYNSGDVECNNIAGGIAANISDNSKILNCYNTGSVIGSFPTGGLAQSISNSEVTNFYNTGTITGNYGIGGIVQSSSNSIIKRCYYLDSSAPQGIYNQQDIDLQVEPKTEAEMKSDEFVRLLNVNKNAMESDIILRNWKYNVNSYPTLNGMEFKEGEALIITNTKEGNNLVINKIDKNTKQQLSGAKFKITNDTTTIELTTNEEGIASAKLPIGEYIITEITAPTGYSLSNEKKKVLVESLSDKKEIIFENEAFPDTENRYSFILTKRDEMTNEIMPGVKFSILDEHGNYAKDFSGSVIGIKENINGEEKYVVTTDENGQIKLKLNVGKYKLIEVQTLEGYALEDETEFEITNTSDNKELSWEGIKISGAYPFKDYMRATNDGGAIVLAPGIGNSIIQNNTIPAEYTANNQPMQIENKDSIVKYNNKGKIEKVLQINGLNEANSVYEDADGNYIISGQAGTLEILAEDTVNGEFITIQNDSTNDQMVTIKLNNELKVIWASKISGICPSWTSPTYIGENKAGNYLVGAYINITNSNKNVVIPAEDTNNAQEIDITLTNGNVLLEYTKEGKVVSFKQVPVSIEDLVEKKEGGYTVINYSKVYELDSEMNLVKESACNFSGITINSCWVTKDEGFIAGGILSTNNTTISGEYTLDGNDITISSQMAPDTILIKYNKDFKIEWVQVNSFENNGLSEINYAVKQDNNGNYYSIVLINTSQQTCKLVKYDVNGNILNIVNIDSNNVILSSHMYSNNNNTQYIIMDNSKQMHYNFEQRDFTALELTVTNKRVGKVIIHHYLEGTGPEYGNDPITFEEAPDEELIGKLGEEYTSTPHMDIPKHTLIKDETGEYVIPENASGEFTEEVQHVYYYYNKNKVNLTVHHYLEGTENKVPLGQNEQGEARFAEDEHSEYDEGDHYKTNASEEVLQKYELVEVVGDEEKDIMQDEVVIYYYRIKSHEITTRVEIPEGRSEDEKGGQISGEGEKPYETVDHEKASIKDITIIPDAGYRVKQIRLVSTNEEGNKAESILYGENATENAEITYKVNEDRSIILTKFENMTEDKEVIVVFEKDEGRLIVHHYIEGTTEKIYDDQITIKPVGERVETKPVKVDNYVVVKEPADRNATITKETQEKTYYYQEQYKITTEVIKHKESYKDGTTKNNVKGGQIESEGKESHELVLKNRPSTKTIEITPDLGYEVVGITIKDGKDAKEGISLDFEQYKEKDANGKATGKIILLEGLFPSMQSDKHIQVEFRKKTKVIVKYLEEPEKQETEDGEEVKVDPEKAKVLSEQIIINGHEGQDFETVKKAIPNYKDSELGITDEKVEKTNSDGIMYADEITVIYWYTRIPSGIIVRHIETNEKAEEKEIESKLVDGLAGLEQPTTRNKYDKYIPVDRKEENKGNTNENITVMSKNQNSKTLTFAENETLEVWYFYEKEYNVTTEVKPHEEKVVNPETGKTEIKQVAGGTISKKYEKDEAGNDKLDDKGNKIETVYEKILSRGDSKEGIEIKPDDGYRIKTVIKQKKVIVNGKETSEDEKVFIENMIKEDGSVILPEGQLTDVQNDYNIVVEFERIPAKVIVEYKDAYTKETIHEDKER